MSAALLDHLDRRAILVGVRARDAGEAIDALAARLVELGRVRESWGAATKAREAVLPTGLPLGAVNAAIPHTDPEHVIEAAIGLAVLAEPVRFASMDDPDEELDVRVVVALAIREKGAQIPMLQSIVGALGDEVRLARLAEAADADEVLAALRD